MRSNFEFLKEVEPPVLYRIAQLAESYLYTDPNGCLVKLRQFAEVMVNEVLQTEHIALPYDNTQANRINLLKHKEIIEYQLANLLHQLRLKGNEAVQTAHNRLRFRVAETAVEFDGIRRTCFINHQARV